MAVYLREKSLTKEEGKRMKVVDFIEISAIHQLIPPTPQATQVFPPSLENEYARYASLYPGSLRNGSERIAPEAALPEDTNVSHPGPCEGQNTLALDPTSNPAPSMLVPIEGSAIIIKEKSDSEAKIKEAELQRADRAKQRDASRRASEAYFASTSVNGGNEYQRKARKKILQEIRRQELLDVIAGYNAGSLESP
ncbi:hypothetical protein FIBSPDRAFT_846986 [Athelia psychrophila]|uniref:Uncharacterized protein n=1 Tax=Athelia psychrophila TaxID=1759441 RepID=A0A166WK40_9AGAM|nr:hypothetical protein FIBSPDRAFT_846986 [Fibularhizoctonia sp. CBS 109695]